MRATAAYVTETAAVGGVGPEGDLAFGVAEALVLKFRWIRNEEEKLVSR